MNFLEEKSDEPNFAVAQGILNLIIKNIATH
jgi:hypothetical protein